MSKIIPDKPTIKPLQLQFTKFCCTIGNLPTSYLSSLTYEEQILWLCNYLEETVIPTLNNNGEAVTELQNLYVTFSSQIAERQNEFEINITELFNELKTFVDNYFDNLDVQEEINNKLDEMMDEGTLQQIIYDYLGNNSLKIYETVSDLKLEENFNNTNYVQTLGYHSKGDDGGAIYKIRNKTQDDVIDNSFLLSLYNEDLVAELIYDTIINVKQLGAYGDNQHGDSAIIQKAFDLENISQIYFPKGNYIAGNLKMYFPVDLLGDEARITNTLNVPLLDIVIDGEYRNHFIKNLRFINNGSGNAVEINTTSSFITSKIENCYFGSNGRWLGTKNK